MEVNAKLLKLIDEIRQLRFDKQVVEKALEVREAELRDYFDIEDDCITHQGVDIVTYKVYARESIDAKWLKSNYPDIAERCKRKAEYRRLVFK